MFSSAPNSPVRVHARKFGSELRKAREARGVGIRRIEEIVGFSRSTLRQYEAGYNLPTMQSATALAEALDWPRLIDIARTGHTIPCRNCGEPFVRQASAQRYCSDRCQAIAQKKAGVDTRRRADTAESRLADTERMLNDFRASVVKMCDSCEPEGTCRMKDCALRPVSPLPLAGARSTPTLTPAAGPWGSGENRERLLTAIRAANRKRWQRPGARELQSEQTRQRWADMTPERRAEVGQKISTRLRSHQEKAS